MLAQGVSEKNLALKRNPRDTLLQLLKMTGGGWELHELATSMQSTIPFLWHRKNLLKSLDSGAVGLSGLLGAEGHEKAGALPAVQERWEVLGTQGLDLGENISDHEKLSWTWILASLWHLTEVTCLEQI